MKLIEIPVVKIRDKFGKTALTIIMFTIGIAMIVPFVWMISASFKAPLEIFEYPIKWIPENPRFTNYTEVFTNKYYPFLKFYLNSIKVVFFSLAGMLAVSSSAAYAFAKLEFKLKNILFLIFLATLMIPTQITLIPRFALFHWLGIYNTHLALILPGVFNVLGIFLMRQYFITIPMELNESARIDGAGHLRIWLQIVMPLSKPAILSLIILGFVWNWNDYINPLIFLNNKELYTIPVGLQVYMETDLTRYHLIMAGASVAVIPAIVVFLICQKYFIQGITSSGIKG